MLTCKICGSFKIENKELALCATHNRERRKPEPEKANIKPIVKLSPKMRIRLRKKAEMQAQALKDRKNTGYCETCQQRKEWLTWSHTLSVKQFPHLEADPENNIIECISCHTMYEHNKPLFSVTYPEAWKKKLAYIKSVHPEYLALL
jgi:hypothetical protein